MDKAKIICAFLFITFVVSWVFGGIFLAVYVTKDDRLETGKISYFALSAPLIFIYLCPYLFDRA